MKTLSQFISETQANLTKFECYWHTQHLDDPELFPLELDDDNSGLWDELFEQFNDKDYKYIESIAKIYILK